MMKVNQRGFSVVEILMVIAIVGLIGTVGWLVYDRQNTKPNSNDTSVQTSRQEQKQDPPKQEAVNQPTFFEVKELGVKFELTDNLKDLYYTMGNNNKTAYFSLNELKGTDCAADKTAQIALTRYTDADYETDFLASKEKARKIDNYYYTIVGGQAGCSEDVSVQKKASQLRVDISNLLPDSLIVL